MCNAMAKALLIPPKSIRLSGRKISRPRLSRSEDSINASEPEMFGNPSTCSESEFIVSSSVANMFRRTPGKSTAVRSRHDFVLRAGRISFVDIHGFDLQEVGAKYLRQRWWRGIAARAIV